SRFHTTEESFDCFVEIARNHLQDVGMNLGGEEIILPVDLYSPDLVKSAYRAAFSFVHRLAFAKAVVVEAAGRLQRLLQQQTLSPTSLAFRKFVPLCRQGLSSVSPSVRMRQMFVVIDKIVENPPRQVSHGQEVAATDHAALQDAKPD